ncbi:calpain-13-like [Rhinophrynus dorsalis]
MLASRTNGHPRQQGYNAAGSLETPRRFKNQDFDTLRELHLKKGLLFNDDSFPADQSSLGPKLADKFSMQKVEWKRPWAFCKDPHLLVDGASLFDILQRKIGNCWVLSVIGSITLKQNLLKNIMPLNQGYTVQYAGIFHFKFWYFGEWVDVVIDDQLPFVNDDYLSIRPCCSREFWPCLLEKAYAKLLGSYENLHWGDPAEAFVNFTGGVAMTFDLKSSSVHQSDIWEMVYRASPKTLITCISEKQSIKENIQLSSGLIQLHAYSVTDTTQVYFRNGLVNLIRIWNPWGYGEWMGRWSDNCPWWREVSPEDRKKLYDNREDGEFWMSWDDFVQGFSRIIICSRAPDFLDWGVHQKPWYKSVYKNIWPKDSKSTAGINKDLFSKNPQYLITVSGFDEVKKGYNVVISLMQNHSNKQKFGGEWLPIGFLLSKVDAKVQDLQGKMPSSFFSKELLSGVHIYKQRDIIRCFRLAPGQYVIIPYTTNRDQESSFLLQIFLKSKDGAIEIDSPRITQLGSCDVGVGNSQKEAQLPTQQRNGDQFYEDTFKRYATQEGKMNAWDLQKCLNEEVLKGYPSDRATSFSIDATRGMLASMDYTCNGKLEVDFFGRLWGRLALFKDIFTEVDTSGSGIIGLPELQKALTSAGMTANKVLLNSLMYRYGNSEMKLSFVDYLCCMVRLKSAFKTFQILSNDGKGIYVSEEKWLQLMMSS